jgi:hypothetical protein
MFKNRNEIFTSLSNFANKWVFSTEFIFSDLINNTIEYRRAIAIDTYPKKYAGTCIYIHILFNAGIEGRGDFSESGRIKATVISTTISESTAHLYFSGICSRQNTNRSDRRKGNNIKVS